MLAHKQAIVLAANVVISQPLQSLVVTNLITARNEYDVETFISEHIDHVNDGPVGIIFTYTVPLVELATAFLTLAHKSNSTINVDKNCCTLGRVKHVGISHLLPLL
jgi:hypothetical protein